MSRKDRNIKYNPKLAHKEKFKKINQARNQGGQGNKGNKPSFNNGDKVKKSGFNKSFRAPKSDQKRPGKNKRTTMRNKNK